jgi:ribosome-associated protein
MTERDETLDKVFECARVAAEKRGADIRVLGVSHLTSYTDYFLIISATSERRVQTIAQTMRREMKEKGHLPLGAEGLDAGGWALLDFGAFVVHIFFEDVRHAYDLEGLWSDAKKVKLPKEVIKAMDNAEDDEEDF